MLSLSTWRMLVDPKPADAATLYELGVKCYEHHTPFMAAVFLRAHLTAAGQPDLRARRNTNGCPNNAPYASFARAFSRFLEDTQSAWSRGAVAPPPFLRGGEAAPAEAVLQRVRPLLVIPQYIMASDRYVECDFSDHLFQSQINAGIDAQQFFNDRIAYPVLQLDPAKAAEDLGKLRETVARLRTNVLLIDANFMPDAVTINTDYLTALRREFPNLKLVAFIGDAWGDAWVPIADTWATVCDLVVHIAPGGAVEQQSKFPEKLLLTPYPVNERNFFREPERSLDLSFFGSYVSYLRPFWLTEARRAVAWLGLNGNLRGHQRSNDCPTMAEYGAIMRASRIVLNCSSRYGRVKMMTGRVWQAIHSGAVLLEEDNEATKHFFVPFVHYVPYENARQLRHMIAFFARQRDWAERIGENAAAFAAQHYSAARIWARTYARLEAATGPLSS